MERQKTPVINFFIFFVRHFDVFALYIIIVFMIFYLVELLAQLYYKIVEIIYLWVSSHRCALSMKT